MSEAEGKGLVFALTGGIGSGKTTVAKHWQAAGVAIVSADELAREAVAPGTSALAAVAAEFGDDVLFPDGSLDRKKLGARVFKDEAARARLNAIVHPEVRRLAEIAFERELRKGAELVCYDVPLLFETGQQDRFRPVVVVTATPLQQMERSAARDNLPPTEVAARLRAQMPLREKEALADVVIVNGGSLAELSNRAEKALSEVRAWGARA